ncbi:MAG: response regulator [Halothece sp.]
MMKKILVIEPEEAVREKIAVSLERKNFRFIPATTGEQGIDIALEELPDLIVCNLVLPNGEGSQVLEVLRDKKETQSVPVIVITDKTSRKSYRMAMELGADDYLIQPFSNEELIKAIKTRLRRKDDLEKKYQNTIKQLKKQLNSKQEKEAIQEEVWEHLFTDLRSHLGKIKLAIHLLQEANFLEKKKIYIELLEQECLAMIDLINRVSELRVLLTPDHLELIQRYNRKQTSENPKSL